MSELGVWLPFPQVLPRILKYLQTLPPPVDLLKLDPAGEGRDYSFDVDVSDLANVDLELGKCLLFFGRE